MAVRLAPIADARVQCFDDQGNVLAGGKLFSYAAGSTTKQNTYTSSTGLVANANPIVLDADGRTPNGVWITTGLTYKFVLAPANDTDPPTSPLWTEDNITGIGDATSVNDQWIASGLTPTYISATSFSLSGDQTTEYHIGRRLKTTNSGGTIYSRISVSSHAAGTTTITVVNDSGTLDAGLSAVSYGLLTATNHAIPVATIVLAGLTVSGLTSGRIPLISTSGLITDSGTILYTDSATTKKINLVGSGSTAASFDVQNTHATGLAAVFISTSGDGDAKLQATTGGTGDAYASLICGANTWYAGVDNSDSDSYVIGLSTVGADNKVRIDGSTGAMTLQGGLAAPTGGSASARLFLGNATGLGIYWGEDAPTVTAPKGSLYLRTNGSSGTTRAYINTDGGTTWTAINTVA